MARSSPDEIADAVRRILIDELKVSRAIVEASNAATPLVGHGIGLDSVETVGLALCVEREFDIRIPDGELTDESFESLGAFAEYVSRKIGGPRQ
jgi:acyl carrier protein